MIKKLSKKLDYAKNVISQLINFIYEITRIIQKTNNAEDEGKIWL